MEDLLGKLIDKALKAGANYADARYQEYSQTIVTAENGALRSYESDRLTGVGIRVLVDGALGFASSSSLEPRALSLKVKEAVKMAKASRRKAEDVKLSEAKPRRDEVKLSVEVDPEEVPPEKGVKLTIEANKAAMIGSEIKNSTSRLGMGRDVRLFASSEGSLIRTDVAITGFGQLSVAMVNGNMERVPDVLSECAGFEYLERLDLNSFAREVSELAIKAARSRQPPAGTYAAIVDPELIGLFLHEALGHASEGDLVATRESVLEGKLGMQVASELVTIYDDGGVKGGYFVPYDDEGVRKGKTVIVEEGILKGYLASRHAAYKLGVEPTGNGRAQNFMNRPIVRMTNVYMEPRDWGFEELVKDVDYGLYIRGKGALGGQVDVGGGTFTFSAGPSYIIEHGEIKEMVRGVTLSGKILETLKAIDAVGRDFEVRTSAFGGCEKEGQLAKVGDGGPHVRVRRLTIGGRA